MCWYEQINIGGKNSPELIPAPFDPRRLPRVDPLNRAALAPGHTSPTRHTLTTQIGSRVLKRFNLKPWLLLASWRQMASSTSVLTGSDLGWLTTPMEYIYIMMTSSNGNVFRVTGHLCGDFTGTRWIPLTKASDAELWYFLWSAPVETVK